MARDPRSHPAGRAPSAEGARARPPALRGWEDVYARSLDCVHCGLCLPVCPTYVETGREVSSPRGRIYLMRGVAEGRIPLGDVVAHEAYLCLGCRACESACPSGVQYGAMVERTREEVRRAGLRRSLASRLEVALLRGLVPRPRRLALAFDALALAQRAGLDRWVALLLPRRLREARALLPPVPPRRERRERPERVPAEGERRGRVGLLTGCIVPELFPGANAATRRVLARNGFEVVEPRGQGCCGALQFHAGDGDTARALARRNLHAFADVDAIVSNSAGCGAALRDVGHWLGEDPGAGADEAARAEAFSARARDVCELLDAEGLREPTHRVDATVCYDDPCHLVHGQKISDAPRRLLARIPGLELVPHADPRACCGAAGTYNLTHPAMSRAVLEHKLDALAAADPDFVATGNPGCLMQLRAGLAARGLRARAVHPVELLDRAYGA